MAILLYVLFLLSFVEFCATASFNPQPKPLDRAEQALNGLLLYFYQEETSNRPIPKERGCPCHFCNGKNCSVPDCVYCSTLDDDACPTKHSQGCYTTAKAVCVCDLPPGPIPAGATSAAKYFFACGQMGGLTPNGWPSDPSKCTCETDWPSSCTFCYRWWSALALEAAANYAIAAGLNLKISLGARIMSIANSIWIHSPYNAEWNAIQKPVFVDDFVWYAIAYLRMYDLTKDDVWRRRAAAIHEWAWKYGWDKRLNARNSSQQCGGFWWNLGRDKLFKDSISIVEVLHSAARLATTITPAANRTNFLKSAEKIWDWLFAFDNGTGLFSSNGIMSTGALPEKCCNANFPANFSSGRQCVNSRIPGMSYNHGILLSSSAVLYNVTGNDKYLTQGRLLLNAAFENLTNSDGAIKDLQRGSRADVYSAYDCTLNSGDPGSDFFSFKGVFITHLTYFAQVLNASGVLSKDMYSKVLSMVKNSSDSAWTKSAVHPPFIGNDVCSPKSKYVMLAKFSYPKFHWWWTTSNVSMETPPDPRLWFIRSGIRCTYNESNVEHWKGKVLTQAACQNRCEKEAYGNCTIFQYYDNTAQSGVSGYSCPCYTCDDQPCNQPRCERCGILKEKSCPFKNTTGCYTTASAACDCTNGPPEGKKVNCWLYKRVPAVGFDRNNGPACAGFGYGYAVGVRRPPPPSFSNSGSCKERCQKDAARFFDNSNHDCYCDSACPRHMDCCLDYVDECITEEKQQPTCLNNCITDTVWRSATKYNSVANAVAHPIKGGGYCFCDSACTNVFTDNNSYGGCCADYTWRCANGSRDQLCLDARTQTQAISLFVGHHILENGLSGKTKHH